MAAKGERSLDSHSRREAVVVFVLLFLLKCFSFSPKSFLSEERFSESCCVVDDVQKEDAIVSTLRR